MNTTRAALSVRLCQAIRELGWFTTVCYAASVFAERWTGGYCAVFKYDLLAQAVAPARAHRTGARTITVRDVAHDEAAPALLLRATPVIRRRYGQGAECLAAFRGDELLGFMWYVCGPYDEDEVRARFVPIGAHGAWDFDIEILPPHRMGMAFARLWEAANARLHARGVRWSYSRISAFNVASRLAHQRAGAVRIGRALFVRTGRWQWTIATTTPYMHLSRDGRSRPHFTLAPPCDGTPR